MRTASVMLLALLAGCASTQPPAARPATPPMIGQTVPGNAAVATLHVKGLGCPL